MALLSEVRVYNQLSPRLTVLHSIVLIFGVLLMALLSMAVPSGTSIAMPATDKVAHFSSSGLATAALIKLRQSQTPDNLTTWQDRLVISSLIFALGVYKEWDDQRRGKEFDLQDITANSGGILVGNVVQWEF